MPVCNPRHMSMLDRIEVNVIHMPLQIQIIADLMFPKSPLPYPFFALRNLAFTASQGSR